MCHYFSNTKQDVDEFWKSMCNQLSKLLPDKMKSIAVHLCYRLRFDAIGDKPETTRFSQKVTGTSDDFYALIQIKKRVKHVFQSGFIFFLRYVLSRRLFDGFSARTILNPRRFVRFGKNRSTEVRGR
jgi:hypothetical protein